jgi:uncharacterized protein YegL
MREMIIRDSSLVSNPMARIPIILCLDCSPSMSGDPKYGAPASTAGAPIKELNHGLRSFIQCIKNDLLTRYSAEIAIVGFSSIIEQLNDFCLVDNMEIPTLKLDLKYGGSSIGKAISKCLELLEDRKALYKIYGVDYYQPWLVLMTDGYPTDESHLEVINKLHDLIDGKQISVFPIGIGENADLKFLHELSPQRVPLRIKTMKFSDFFIWLGRSISRVSQSIPNDSVDLDIEGIKEWAQP